MENNCFICLEDTNNRICKICQCYAHKKCFNKYLNKNTKIIGNIYHTSTYIDLEIESEFICPICKFSLNEHKKITRNDTLNIRKDFVIYILNYYLSFIDEDIDNKKNYKYFSIICKFLLNHKDILNKIPTLKNIIQEILYEAKDMWSLSNFYSLQLFGEQFS
jgi:hypothetical protein